MILFVRGHLLVTIVVLDWGANAKRFYDWVTNDILLIEERGVTNIKLTWLSIS
jgi:hypothetical protein